MNASTKEAVRPDVAVATAAAAYFEAHGGIDIGAAISNVQRLAPKLWGAYTAW